MWNGCSFPLAAPESKYILIPGFTHEATPYFFDILGPEVSAWLSGEKAPGVSASEPGH